MQIALFLTVDNCLLLVNKTNVPFKSKPAANIKYTISTENTIY